MEKIHDGVTGRRKVEGQEVHRKGLRKWGARRSEGHLWFVSVCL